MESDERDGLLPRRGGGRQRAQGEQLHAFADSMSEYLLYAILIFTPWAFGTTERWAINTVNALNFALGGLLAAKWIVQWTTGFRPERWDDAGEGHGVSPKWIMGPLTGLSIFMLLICAVSAWNARAEFHFGEQRFDYFENYLKWLPHSYDQSESWEGFRMYLAAALFFFALRDWLLTKSQRDSEGNEGRRREVVLGPRMADAESGHTGRYRFPDRLKRLLWVLCVNGAILAVEGTLQRLSGTGKLLWTVSPRFNRVASAQFGPFNYRTNGAQYLNMIWPISLAFWWGLHQSSRKKLGEGAEFVLLPFTGLMLAAPIIASSRGGVVIAVGQAIAAAAILAYAFRRSAWKATTAASILIVVVLFAAALQWRFLVSRFNEKTMDNLGGRSEIYENAKNILNDFPVWGTGPKTFPAVYQLYRSDPNQVWFANAHNDYLEILISFGRVGLTAILSMLVLVFSYWFFSRGVPASSLFTLFAWISAGGALAHARFDFPFQLYSLLLLFLTICAMLTTVARR